MKRPVFAAILAFVFIFSACKLQRRTLENPEGKGSASTVNYEKLSEKFDYPLEGNENPELVLTVESWLGTPYKYGGCTQKGTDCSCLIKNIYKEVYNVELPRRSIDMSKKARKIRMKNIQEGDLLFFNTVKNRVSHVGIYISQGYFVHASSSRGVVINNIDENYYKNHFNFAGRIRKE